MISNPVRAFFAAGAAAPVTAAITSDSCGNCARCSHLLPDTGAQLVLFSLVLPVDIVLLLIARVHADSYALGHARHQAEALYAIRVHEVAQLIHVLMQRMRLNNLPVPYVIHALARRPHRDLYVGLQQQARDSGHNREGVADGDLLVRLQQHGGLRTSV